ncbi:MAG: VIT1/CCC1 transporter family protein, partial [Myxococcota bacterium]
VSTLELGEGRAAKKYFDFLQHAPLDENERQTVRGIILDELEHEVTFRKESQSLGLGHVRDFVLGMNDGLVEILGTVTGLTAVYASSPLTVGASGLIVGVAGALSMGIGAFMSVRSQRQVNEGATERLSVLFAVAPERATREYHERLVDSGVPRDVADAIAQKVAGSEQAVTRLLLEPSDESELRSGALTGLAYLFGVAFPVLPFFVAGSSVGALSGAVLLAGLALGATGGLVSILSGIPLRRKVLEMVGAGFGAAILSYGFGSLLDRWIL